MTTSLTKLAYSPTQPEAELLDALPLLVATVNRNDELKASNKAAQEFWGKKAQRITDPLYPMVARVREHGKAVTVHDFAFIWREQEYRGTLHIAPLNSDDESLLVAIDLKGVPYAPTASAWKQETTRAAGVMAAMLAHEVKNPLSSIRGAAQLLRENMAEADRPLADLICDESLRICDLLDQVEIFADEREIELSVHNIHEILQYTMKVAKAGFSQHVTFIERYDPSLPDVMTQRESLVQIVLNIIKNASEAMIDMHDATIILSSFYQSGVTRGGRKLPVVVKIEDNGTGISEEIRKKLFEPLVSSKEKGRGLGLSVVAKLADDIGVIVECDEKREQGAGFTIYLPIA